VLVVIADPKLSRLVGWLLGELDLSHVLAARWRAGVAAVTEWPSLLLCQVDHLHQYSLSLTALAARGWDSPVPLIIFSRRTDVEEIGGCKHR
jgi:hypothetical protein